MAKPTRPRDPNQLARLIVDIAAGDEPNERPEKDEAAVALGRKGGKARAARMSDERKVEIARKAAQVRWKKD
jgi:hypothetical protein